MTETNQGPQVYVMNKHGVVAISLPVRDEEDARHYAETLFADAENRELFDRVDYWNPGESTVTIMRAPTSGIESDDTITVEDAYGRQTYIGTEIQLGDLIEHIRKGVEAGYFLNHVSIVWDYERDEDGDASR